MVPVNEIVSKTRRRTGPTPGGRGPGTGVGDSSDEGDVPRQRPERLTIGRPRFGPPAVFRSDGCACADGKEDGSSSTEGVDFLAPVSFGTTAASWASKQASKHESRRSV
jgi:hypothetical protein